MGCLCLKAQKFLSCSYPTLSLLSGDALLGGLLHALLTKKLPFEDALAFAVATGTANTLVDGPGYVEAEVVQRLWSQVNLRRL